MNNHREFNKEEEKHYSVLVIDLETAENPEAYLRRFSNDAKRWWSGRNILLLSQDDIYSLYRRSLLSIWENYEQDYYFQAVNSNIPDSLMRDGEANFNRRSEVYINAIESVYGNQLKTIFQETGLDVLAFRLAREINQFKKELTNAHKALSFPKQTTEGLKEIYQSVQGYLERLIESRPISIGQHRSINSVRSISLLLSSNPFELAQNILKDYYPKNESSLKPQV